jgi:hypothetical protein
VRGHETGLVVTTTLGGVASIAGGGKFANGAVTGAFGYQRPTWNSARRPYMRLTAPHYELAE